MASIRYRIDGIISNAVSDGCLVFIQPYAVQLSAGGDSGLNGHREMLDMDKWIVHSPFPRY